MNSLFPKLCIVINIEPKVESTAESKVGQLIAKKILMLRPSFSSVLLSYRYSYSIQEPMLVESCSIILKCSNSTCSSSLFDYFPGSVRRL